MKTAWSAVSHIPQVLATKRVGVVSKLVNGCTRRAKAPGFDEFWDLDPVLKKLTTDSEQLFKDPVFNLGVSYEDARKHSKLTKAQVPKLLATTRKVCLFLWACNFMGRGHDVWSIYTYQYVAGDAHKGTPSALWVRCNRKGQDWWTWIPLLQANNGFLCPVRAFWRYSRMVAWMSNKDIHAFRPPKDGVEPPIPGKDSNKKVDKEQPKHNCLWKCSTGEMEPLTINTVASDIKFVLKSCGVDTDKWSARSVRGAVATALVDLGIPAETVAARGQWASMMTFQKHYNRSGQKIPWMDVLSKGIGVHKALLRGWHNEDKETYMGAVSKLEQASQMVAQPVPLDDEGGQGCGNPDASAGGQALQSTPQADAGSTPGLTKGLATSGGPHPAKLRVNPAVMALLDNDDDDTIDKDNIRVGGKRSFSAHSVTFSEPLDAPPAGKQGRRSSH